MPEVLGRDENGNEVKLSDFKGKKLVLYFYPKDMTSGCTTEACNLRDNYGELKAQGYEVVGVSVDDGKKHQKFIEKNELPFRHGEGSRRAIRRVGREENVRTHVHGHTAHDVHHRRRRHDRARHHAKGNQGERPCGANIEINKGLTKSKSRL